MKREIPSWQVELDELLSQLCDGTADPAIPARIEQIASRSPEAMWHYVTYLDLHTSLIWDTASAPEVAAEELLTPASVAPAGGASSRWRKPGRWVAATAALAAAIVFALFATPPNDPPAAPAVVDVPAANEPANDPAEKTSEETDAPARHREPLQLTGNDRAAASPAEADPAGPAPDDAAAPQDTATVAAATEEPVELINREIAEGWKRAGIEPSPIASDSEWLRRVYLDLVGHIPPVEVVTAFQEDRSPDKRERLVDKLLNDPSHARHLATVWTNLLIGRVKHSPDDRARLHGYLADQFATQRPWSDVVGELLTATGSNEENGAATFLLAHLNNQAVPATAITSRVFLGRNLLCVQCHNHPFNDWKQEQFWEFNSFFQQTLAAVDRPQGTDMRPLKMLQDRSVGGPTYYETRNGLMRVAYPKFSGTAVDPSPETNRRRALADLITEGDDIALAEAFVNRTWSQLLGYGFTTPVDDMGPHNPPSHPQLLSELARRFADSGYDVRSLVRWICLSKPYQLSSALRAENELDHPELGEVPWFSRGYTKPMSAEQLYDSMQVAAHGLTNRDVDWRTVSAERDAWIEQFFRAYNTEENDEESTFHGTLTQALLMMNGPLTDSVTEAARQMLNRRGPGPRTSLDDAIRLACRATLNRDPSPREIAAIRRVYQERGGEFTVAPSVIEDAVWAFMNSAEFLTVP